MSFIAPLGSQPICNPSIPYLGPIVGGLRPGMSIYIQGSTPHHMKRFDLNLLCGEMAGSDIALHVNPRFDGWDKVVFKCFQNGCWGHEHKTHHMPFYKGEGFEMVIIVTQEGYQINVNGRELHHFAHRIPVQRVCALQIEGEVFIQTINVIGGGMGGYPGGMGGGMVGGYQGGGMGGCMGGCEGVCVCIGRGMGGGMAGVYPGGMGQGGYPGGMGGYSMGGMGAYPGGMGGYPGGVVGGYQGGGMGGCMGSCEGVCVCIGRGMGGFM